MIKLAAFITRHLVYTIPASMMAGFLYGLALDPAGLKMLIVPLTFLMVYPMMITLKVDRLLERGGAKVQWLTQALNFLVIPFIALLLGNAFFGDKPFLVLGLFLAALLPTSGMTISYTGLSGGNVEAAIRMTVIGLIAGSLLAPLYLSHFLGASIRIDISGIMTNIALIVFLPMAAGYATQRLLIRRHGQPAFNKQIGPKCGPLSTFGVIGVVFVATALNAKSIVQDPSILPSILVPLVVFYAVNFAISIGLGKALLPRDDAIALLYGSVLRNLSIALAVIMNAFGDKGSDAALIISLAYIIQVQSAAWFLKFADRVYGPRNAPHGA